MFYPIETAQPIIINMLYHIRFVLASKIVATHSFIARWLQCITYIYLIMVKCLTLTSFSFKSSL